ncbi:MAG: SGNH/GDSL hydrolase family protein [Candidatus Kerfeldbacteria bacterium]|nr:SGNH/GDSL hydrolase family protein [Candidatus Kerfeldbacteria bacterium]
MRTNTTLVLVIVLLVVLGAVVVLVFGQPEAPEPSASSQPTEQSELATVARAFNDLAQVRAFAPPSDRVGVLGGSLFVVEDGALAKRLEQALGWPLERAVEDGMTSIGGLAAAAELLIRPPKLLVVDIGRDDTSAGVPVEQTSAAVRELVAKAVALGVKVAVIGGVGTDGNDRLATIVKSSISPSARFVDASPLLLDPTYRSSPTALNARGIELLGDQLAAVLLELRGA